MESQKFSNIELVIQRFVQGQASVEDEKLLYSWIKEDPGNRKRLFQEKDIWESAKLGTKQMNDLELDQWLSLQERTISRKLRFSGIADFLKVAAIIVISLGLGWFGRYLYAQQSLIYKTVEMKTVEATKGQLKEVFLADGTHVWINSDSELSFPSRFDASNRRVELTGEAYFEVKANEEKPFYVKTKSHTVKVVGTRFNVCEYPESHIIETTLEEGKVKIITGNIVHDLLPGEQSSFNTETSKVRIGEADLEIFTTWKEGRYEFRNEPLSKIFQIVERWWDVRIDYPEKLKNERISGVLRRYKPLEQHFELIEQLLPIDYEIDSDEITITEQ
ncbi:FecR family protein [Maribellus maritimus]|uniref:FecR family protein n=1 Tax=Maribellus maritimus TaxID=2870838 RepID=UPI001EEB0687|nr:FecR domain-containing protein [Maribellus maritimus]MCG6187599.1 FecR domain-containing protein [Maribellus maritimus]